MFESTVNIAGSPPKLTAVTPERFTPVMVTVVPGIAVGGLILVITGAGTNINPSAEAVPPGVRTATAPVAPVEPTTTVISRDEATLKRATGTPPRLAALTFKKPVPVIEIVMPGPAILGEKSEILGEG